MYMQLDNDKSEKNENDKEKIIAII